jgi:glycosyltransferase involved in cell wall biosynthesis
MSARPVHRLVIVSHVRHYGSGGRLHAYGPYAREIDIWADLFPEVVIAAPFVEANPPADAVPFTRRNITMHPIAETGGETLWAKLRQLIWLPVLVLGLARAMRRADALHIRCPGNLGLLGVILGPLLGRPRVAKYAGQWNGYRGEAVTVSLQRWLLRHWWRAPVTVYGAWPNQPPHVVPFFTSMMTDEQVQAAVQIADRKTLGSPLRVLFTGRLAPEKRVDALLEAVKIATARGVSLEVRVLGDGPERERLQSDVRRLDIGAHLRFLGALPFDRALEVYDWAHVLVLPSVHSEGWPKVVAEAMCHGLLCIAVDHGQVASMLTGRGILLQRGTPEEIAAALEAVASDPTAYTGMMRNATRWARGHSLEGLRAALAALLSERWNRPVAIVEAHR